MQSVVLHVFLLSLLYYLLLKGLGMAYYVVKYISRPSAILYMHN